MDERKRRKKIVDLVLTGVAILVLLAGFFYLGQHAGNLAFPILTGQPSAK